MCTIKRRKFQNNAQKRYKLTFMPYVLTKLMYTQCAKRDKNVLVGYTTSGKSAN